MKNNKIVIKIILALIILAGIIVTCVWGLNFDLIYSNHKEVDIYIGQEFENQDIYEIAKEVLGNQEIIIQKVELYEDMVSISAKDITDEQLENLNAKLNEKYGQENTIEDITITSAANVKGRDLVKPYVLPVAISLAIIIIYLGIYNAIYCKTDKKIDILKSIVKSIILIVGAQLLYLAILAITRLEVNRLTMPISIIIYIVTTIGILLNLENKK